MLKNYTSTPSRTGFPLKSKGRDEKCGWAVKTCTDFCCFGACILNNAYLNLFYFLILHNWKYPNIKTDALSLVTSVLTSRCGVIVFKGLLRHQSKLVFWGFFINSFGHVFRHKYFCLCSVNNNRSRFFSAHCLSVKTAKVKLLRSRRCAACCLQLTVLVSSFLTLCHFHFYFYMIL